jgi:hypothetical protein
MLWMMHTGKNGPALALVDVQPPTEVGVHQQPEPQQQIVWAFAVVCLAVDHRGCWVKGIAINNKKRRA